MCNRSAFALIESQSTNKSEIASLSFAKHLSLSRPPALVCAIAVRLSVFKEEKQLPARKRDGARTHKKALLSSYRTHGLSLYVQKKGELLLSSSAWTNAWRLRTRQDFCHVFHVNKKEIRIKAEVEIQGRS